ncbi:MAG: outer membrane beta-barrel protein [Verrucomicrobiota bacterium]|nr:outer membrane beta-barrel protein [Verrucomicrobiota bacterium]
MKQSLFLKVGLPLVALTLLFPQGEAKAGGEGFSSTDSKSTFDTKGSSSDLGLGKYSANPFHVSVSVRGGYDDNVDLSPFDERGSAFTNVALTLSYDAGSPRTRIHLDGGVSATYYWDQGNNNFGGQSDDYSVNAWFGFSIVHKATPRLTLSASVSAAYLSRPGFDTFNNTLFAVDRRSQDFFQTTDKFTVNYAWTPRFATATSYTFSYINYDDPVISLFEDRYEHTIGNEFRFLILPTTTFVAEYRFGIVDYVENNNRNSYSHFFLAGVDHSFSPRFNVSFRGGVEVREFQDNPRLVFGNVDNSEVAPYAEATVNYALGQNTSITWFNRYALEQPNVPDALSRQTYRTSLGVRHAFTSRISAGLNFSYQHDWYDQTAALSAFQEDSFDIGLNARYAINRNWAIDVGYQHTELVSEMSLFREFTRNQIYAGATFTW